MHPGNGGKRHRLCVKRGKKQSTSPPKFVRQRRTIFCVNEEENPLTSNPEREGEPPTMECGFLQLPHMKELNKITIGVVDMPIDAS